MKKTVGETSLEIFCAFLRCTPGGGGRADVQVSGLLGVNDLVCARGRP